MLAVEHMIDFRAKPSAGSTNVSSMPKKVSRAHDGFMLLTGDDLYVEKGPKTEG